MSNIEEKTQLQNMQSHIDEAYKILAKGLPASYSATIRERLKNPKINDRMIQNMKNRAVEYPTKNLKILNELVVLAKEHQSAVEQLAELVK